MSEIKKSVSPDYASILFPTELTTNEQKQLADGAGLDATIKSNAERSVLDLSLGALKDKLVNLPLQMSLNANKNSSMGIVVPGVKDAMLMVNSEKEGLSINLVINDVVLPKLPIALSELSDPNFLPGKFFTACKNAVASLYRTNEIFQAFSRTILQKDTDYKELPVKSKNRTLFVLETTFNAKNIDFDVRATRNISRSNNTGTCFISERVSITSKLGRFVVQDSFAISVNSGGYQRVTSLNTMGNQVLRAISAISYSDIVLMQNHYDKFREDPYLSDMAVIQDNGLISFVIARGPGIDFPTQVNWLPVATVKSGTIMSESDIAMTNPTNELGLLSHGNHTIANMIRFMKLLNCRNARARKEMNYRMADTGFGRKARTERPGKKPSRKDSNKTLADKLNTKATQERPVPFVHKELTETCRAELKAVQTASVDELVQATKTEPIPYVPAASLDTTRDPLHVGNTAISAQLIDNSGGEGTVIDIDKVVDPTAHEQANEILAADQQAPEIES